MIVAYPQFFMLLAQLIALAFALALARAGSSNAAKIAIIAMTTSSSIRVKARDRPFFRARRLPTARSALSGASDLVSTFMGFTILLGFNQFAIVCVGGFHHPACVIRCQEGKVCAAEH